MNWAEGYVADIGYTHDFYRELTPALQRFALLSRGIEAGGDASRFTYCDLGCGHGFSSILLAAAHPDSEFHANDILPSHIAYARKLARETGTANAFFYDDSFEDFGKRSLPAFDVIALHGVYSWISEENRRHIIDFIARHLKVGGLVYISYNCHPGWSAISPLRELMMIFSGNPADPILPRVDQALAKIQRLFDTNSAYAQANPGLKQRFESILRQSRPYIAHEYFNRDWTVFHHADVAAELHRAKVDFATTVQMIDHLDSFNLTPDQQKFLNDTPNTDHREVLHDFIVNRQFRRDLYAKGGLPIDVAERDERIAGIRFALTTMPADIPRTLTTTLGAHNVNPAVFDPLLTAFMQGPRSIRQLQQEAGTRELTFPVLLETIIILVAGNHLQPCLDAAGEAARRKRTAAFNTAVMLRAHTSDELGFLASPVTGGGFHINRFEQLFLLARERRHADPPALVMEVLLARNEGLKREGKLLRTTEENLAYLRERHADFLRRLPLLQHLGIAA